MNKTYWNTKDELKSDNLLWTPKLNLEQHKAKLGGARGVMVIVAGNGHGETSSNPGRD